MSDPTRLPHDAARWLAEGPDRAPSELLSRVVERSRSTRQRPGLLAAALGAPSLGARGWGASPRRIWLVLAAAVLGVLIIIAAVGSREPDLLVTRPTSGPVETGSPSESASSSPTEEPPALSHDVLGGSIRLTAPGGASVIDGAGEVTITMDAVRIVIERWSLGETGSIPGLDVGIGGATFVEVVNQAEAAIRARPTLSGFVRLETEVDDRPAVQWFARSSEITLGRTTPFAIVVVAEGDTAYAVVGYVKGPTTGGAAIVVLSSVWLSIDFLRPFEVTGLGGRITMTLPGTLRVDSSTPERLAISGPGFGLFTSGLTIRHVRLGDPISFDITPFGVQTLPGSGRFNIEGRTLTAYAASLETANPILFSSSSRTAVRIGGRDAFEWSYRIGSFLGSPVLASTSIVVVGQDVYVFDGRLEPPIDVVFN